MPHAGHAEGGGDVSNVSPLGHGVKSSARRARGGAAAPAGPASGSEVSMGGQQHLLAMWGLLVATSSSPSVSVRPPPSGSQEKMSPLTNHYARSFSWWYRADTKGANVTTALAMLASAGGVEVATSFLVYCNDTIDPTTGRFAFGEVPACALRSPGPGVVQLAPALRVMGVRMERCLGHVDDAQTLRKFLARGDENLADLVTLVRDHGLAGYCFDIEAQGTTQNDTVAYVRWLSRARSKLSQLGARVTAYGYSAHHSATSSSLAALSSAVDRLFDGDTYNYRSRGPTNYSGWLSEYTKLVGPHSNISLSKAAPAMMVSTERGAWNCNASSIELRLRRAKTDGIHEVGGFVFEPSRQCAWSARYGLELCHCTRTWLPAVRNWLKQDHLGQADGRIKTDDDIDAAPAELSHWMMQPWSINNSLPLRHSTKSTLAQSIENGFSMKIRISGLKVDDNEVTASTPLRCPFCPAPRTTRIVGAAGGNVIKDYTARGDGTSNITNTVLTAQQEGLNALGVDAITCSHIEQLEMALSMTDGSQFKIIAGLESHGGMYRQPVSSHSYCSLTSSGRVDWVNVTTSLATLSLKHPQLLGYRIDDFMSGLASNSHMGVDDYPCATNTSACWSLSDIAAFTSAGRRVNPKLRFLPVIYLQNLGAVHPNGYAIGAPYGGVLDKGAAVTLVATFTIPTVAPKQGDVQLSMFLSSPFSVEASGPLCKPNGSWFNASFVQVAVNKVVLQETDLCTPAGGLDHAGVRAMPQLFTRDISAYVHHGKANELTVKVFGQNTMSGKNYQSANVWDLRVSQGGKLMPVTVSFINSTTKRSIGWLFGHSNKFTSPLKYVDGVYACWQQSDVKWSTQQEKQLYTALLRSMRTALPSHGLLLTTHFGTTNWAQSHGGPANSILPANEMSMMLADGPLADGVMVWWDQLGLGSDIKYQRGIFAPAVSTDPARFPLATEFRQSDMPLGWFARLHAHSEMLLSDLIVQMLEQTTHSPSSGRNFHKVITLGDTTVVYNSSGGNCSKPSEGGEPGGWAPRPCPGHAANRFSSTVACSSACAEVPRSDPTHDHSLSSDFVETVRITMESSGINSVSLGLHAAVDSSEGFAVFWNSSFPSSAAGWGFESGIDPALSHVVAVHEAVENATQILLNCTCAAQNGDGRSSRGHGGLAQPVSYPL